MRRAGAVELAWVVVALLAMLSYRAVVARYYGSFIPQGTGMTHLVPEELAQLSLFITFGLAAVLALTLALRRTEALERASALFAAARRQGWMIAGGMALFAFASSLGVGRLVLGGSVTTDDEHVYRFIARTLETGALVAPSPGQDLDFYREQFVVLTPRARYGKYPIGHPLLLAAGDLVGAETLALPLATGATVLLTYAAGRRALGLSSALLGTMLLALSPQFLLTGGTWLSQVSSTLMMALALLALLAAGAAHGRWWLLAGGMALGYGFLIRPMPHAAFAAAAAGWLLAGRRETSWPRRVGDATVLAVPVAVGVGAFFLVNHIQSGAALTSGYQAFHDSGSGVRGLVAETLGADLGSAASSLFAGVFRENVWLLGWPLSLAPCLLARRARASAPLWGVVGVVLAYRLLLPKAGVSPTGPVYFSEAVPVLCLLAADGLIRLARGETVFGVLLAAGADRPQATVAAAIIASFVTAFALFVPARLSDLRTMAGAQETVGRLLRERGIHHALVFHDGVVPPWTRLSWAYFPGCNSPALDDDVLFVRRMAASDDVEPNLAFWRRRHPDRGPFAFEWRPGLPPALVDMTGATRPSEADRP